MAEKMKAQVFYEKEKMELEELPIPKITDIDVLVRGKGPLILGHEFTGEVVEVGSVAEGLVKVQVTP